MTLAQASGVAAAVAIAALTCPQGAKAKPKIPPKPPVQVKPAQGAVQMPGDNGKIGVPYQLGKPGEELVFTLEKAEFASRFIMSGDVGFPKEKGRLLVLTYAIQNPGKNDRLFFNQSFSFTVVSPDDENFENDGAKANGWQAVHPDRRDTMNMQLKPAQKVRALAVVQMHPKGPVNKLIVQRGKGTPVLRYDLKEKVGAMSSCFGAPPEKMDILEVGSALLTQTVDLGPWEIKVEKSGEELLPIGDYAPDKGKKYAVFTVSIKNASMTPYPLHSGLILTKLVDADGGGIDFNQTKYWLRASTPDAFPSGNIEAGASVRVRILFEIPLLVKAEKLMFRDQQYSVMTASVKLEEPKKDPPPK